MSTSINETESGLEGAAHIAAVTASALDGTPSPATTSSIERYLAEIADPALRENLAREIAGIQRQFGLVFERHHPEGIRLPKHKVKRGSKVVISGRKDSAFYRVARLHRDESTALIVDVQGNEQIRPIAELIVAKEFGDVMYPGLRKVSEVRRGAPEAPVHTIINGENFHALEALQYTHAGKVDLIYIDPPYNTGNADWKYNDRYVDSKDGYRHSKWLSFMEKRLQIARRLLKPTGVIIMAIDDNEHHRLRMLADEIFGETNFLANLVWQGGTKNDPRFGGGGIDYMVVYAFSREASVASGCRWMEVKPGMEAMTEYVGRMLEAYRLADDQLAKGRDMLVLAESVYKERARSMTKKLREWIRVNASSISAGLAQYNSVDEKGRIYRGGPIDFPGGGGPRYDFPHPATGRPVKVPSRGWVAKFETMSEWAANGELIFGQDENIIPTRKLFLDRLSSQTPQPSFVQRRDAATKHIEQVLGDKRFPFPKNHDVLMRWFRMMAPADAVILDFFGGSGTTAEAVVRLNAEDGGTRQTILVTNNELSKADDTKLRKAGHQPGDNAYEALGVFHHVTKPRLETVVTGIRSDGSKYSDGLDANIAFFELTYLDEPEIVTGRAFNDLAGLFWLKAGGIGGTVELTDGAKADGFAVSESGRTAVLFTPGRAQALAEKLATEDDGAGRAISHLFIVTDSAAQGDEAASHFPAGITVERIYGSYLEAFQVNRKD